MAQICRQALTEGIIQTDWILNRLSHAADEMPPETINVVQSLALNEAPVADCDRYDALLSHLEGSHAIH